MSVGVFASSNTELVTYTLSYDEMNTLLSSSLCMLTVSDMSAGGWGNPFQVDVTRETSLDNDYLYFSTSGFPSGSQYQLDFSFVYGDSNSPIISDIYSLDIDSVVFFSNSSFTASNIVPNIYFTPTFNRDDYVGNVPYSTYGETTTHNFPVSLGNGSSINSTRFVSGFTPNATPVSFYGYVLSTFKPPSVSFSSTNYLYVGIKPFTFTAPDDTVNDIVSAIEDLKQNIDKNTQDIIDNQNKNQEQLEDFLGTSSDDDNASLDDMNSNIDSSTEKADEISSALESVEKPNLDEFDFDVTNNDYFDSSYVSSFQSLFNVGVILNMLTIVSVLVAFSYILFGKTS